jgi:hypothetical protein
MFVNDDTTKRPSSMSSDPTHTSVSRICATATGDNDSASRKMLSFRMSRMVAES